MREILFRGKRIDNGEWVEGALLTSDWNVDRYSKTSIVRSFAYDYQVSKHEVGPETVGQYTGLKDKNGNKIFEGDYRKSKYVVQWNPLHCCFGWYKDGGYIKSLRAELYDKSGDTPQYWFIDEEIIGNIHETKKENTHE